MARQKNRAAAARNIAQSFTLSPAEVRVPSAPMVATRYPFIASDGDSIFYKAAQLKNVCRSSKVAPTCYGKGNKKFTPKKLGLRRPTPAEYIAACARVGGKVEKGYNKSIRAGKVELDFLSPAQATKFKTLPGPNLRLCTRDDKAGYLVPVSDPSEAQKLQRDFAKCTGGDKKRMPACALKLARGATKLKNPPLGLLGELATGGLLGGLFTRGR